MLCLVELRAKLASQVALFVGLVKVLGTLETIFFIPRVALCCYFECIHQKKTTLSIPRLCYG